MRLPGVQSFLPSAFESDHFVARVELYIDRGEREENKATVQQFKGVSEEQEAYHGFIVTTSSFNEEAIHSAAMTEKIVLIAMDDLVRWHTEPPIFDFGVPADDISA